MATLTHVIRWADNTAELKRNLSQGLDQIEAVRKSAEGMAKSLGGENLLRAAHNLTAAVTQIGGAAKLTESEKVKLNATLQKAIDKYAALGQTAPAAMRELLTATQKTGPPLDELPKKITLAERAAGLAKSTFGQMFAAFSVAHLVTNAVTNIVRGIVNLGKEAFVTASKTADMSAKLGISTEAIQRMDFVAGQTGSTVEAFASSAFKLQVRLSGGSDSVTSAVRQLGLDFDALKQARPEDQFETVVTALGHMQDATKRNELGMAIFGRSFEQIAAGVAANYGELAKQANVATDAQIQALDRAGDAWDAFKQRASANLRGLLGDAVQNIQAIREVISERGLFSSTSGVLDEARRRVNQGLLNARQGDVALSAGGGAAQETADYVAQLAKAEAAVKALTKEQRAQLDAAIKLGAGESALADQYGLSEEVLRLYSGQVKDHKKDLTEAMRAAQEFKKGQDALFGLDLIARADAAVEQMEHIGLASLLAKDKQAELSRTVIDAIAVQRRLGLQVSETFIAVRNAITPTEQLRQELLNLEAVTEDVTVDLKALGKIPAPLGAMQNDLIALETTFRTTGINGLLTNLGDELKKIGDIGKRVPTVFGSIADSVKALVNGMTGGKGLAGFFSNLGQGVVEGFGNIISGGISGLINKGIGLAVSGIKKLGQMIGGGPSQKELEGRDVIADFEKQIQSLLSVSQKAEAGGKSWAMTTIAVRDAYIATGRSALDAERDVKALWDSSKKGAEAAKAAADKIHLAFIEQQQDAERLEKAIKTYGFSIEELGPKFQAQRLNEQAKELIEDWRVLVGSGIDLALVNDKMAASINGYLQAALRTGTEVPFAFKPILQSLIDQGKLVDANGNLITDLGQAGVTFAETLTQGFDRVVVKLQQLIDTLNGAGRAIENLPTIDVPSEQAMENVSLWKRITGNAIPMASGGVGRVTSPTLFLAGEAGAEDFAFSGGGKRFGGGGDSSAVVAAIQRLGERMDQQAALMPLMVRDQMLKARA